MIFSDLIILFLVFILFFSFKIYVATFYSLSTFVVCFPLFLQMLTKRNNRFFQQTANFIRKLSFRSVLICVSVSVAFSHFAFSASLYPQPHNSKSKVMQCVMLSKSTKKKTKKRLKMKLWFHPISDTWKLQENFFAHHFWYLKSSFFCSCSFAEPEICFAYFVSFANVYSPIFRTRWHRNARDSNTSAGFNPIRNDILLMNLN